MIALKLAKELLLLILVIGALQLNPSSAKTSPTTKAKISDGINNWLKVCEAIQKDAKNPLFNLMGKMAQFLSVAFGFVSFISTFSPQDDSQEVKIMKHTFTEATARLDNFTIQLDYSEDLLKDEGQRTVYLNSAEKIKFGFQKMNEFFNELEKMNCVSHTNCTQVRKNILSRYVEYFDVQYHLNMILSDAVSQTPFNGSLLDLVSKTHSCDVGKLDIFSNSMLKLAFKAQMVIIAYNKVNGSKISVANSVKNWLKSVYDLRDYTYKLKNDCYDDVKHYMLADINNSEYQTDFAEDEKASDALREFMKGKYSWLDWNVYTYNAYGRDQHYIFNLYGEFWNSPKSKEKRNRNIAVSLIDKAGTYEDQALWVWNAVDEIARDSVCGIGCADDLDMLFDMLMIEMKKKKVWDYILSIVVLRSSIKTSVLADDPLTYIDKLVTFQERRSPSQGEATVEYLPVRLLITVKSLEMEMGEPFDDSCNNHGLSITLPYSSERRCQCKRDFDGENCQHHSKHGIVSTIDALIATTLCQPPLMDIYQDASDLRESIGFGNVDLAINDLRSTLKNVYDHFGKEMSQEFAGVTLQTIYSKSIQLIQYYDYRFKNLLNSADVESEEKKLAEAILGPEGVREWLYNLNELFMGNTISSIGAHKPFMIKTIDNNIGRACSAQYKVDIDNAYRQFIILQQKGYIIWAQALEILEMDTDIVETTYQRRLEHQDSRYNEMTCLYAVEGSITMQCSGGRYIHPSIILTNICKMNYYLKGRSTTTCVSKSTTCEPCSCYAPGSDGLECTDQTGKCKCKAGFYGDKCGDRDCVWNNWSAFSSCTKSCDYGGTQYKSRSYRTTRVGNGKPCLENSRISRSCLNGCCKSQFHCSNKKKCIPASYRCNYNNDCGDKEDEKDNSCQESCSYKYTGWNDDGKGQVYYLDRHYVNCGGGQFVLQMFHLERSGRNIRYKYRCCQLNKDISQLHSVVNGASHTESSCVYLDRQAVRCPSDSYLNGFRLTRPRGDQLSYHYNCNKLRNSNHKSRQSCITSSTSATDDGGGNNNYLDRQTVDCGRHGKRYFLNYFHLKRYGRSHWYYEYSCCRIVS